MTSTIPGDSQRRDVDESANSTDEILNDLDELSRRLDDFPQYDELIDNARGQLGVQSMWRERQAQEQVGIERLKTRLMDKIKLPRN